MSGTSYVGQVLKFHPQGWSHPFWAGATLKPGNSRRTDICQHQHDSEDGARQCADNLAALRNAKALRRTV